MIVRLILVNFVVEYIFMFDDDNNDDDFGQLDELLSKYESVKNGTSSFFLDEEEFERVIEYYFQSSKEEQALLACNIASTYYPFSSAILLLKAEIFCQVQKYGQALKALDEMEQYDNNNLDAVLLRADILLAQNKHTNASEWLEHQSTKFIGIEKTEILLELSDVYDECENYDAVFDTLKRVIKIDKRNEEALQKICFWSEFTGRLEESVELHIKLTDDDPYNPLAWFNLGAAYQGLKLYEKCIDAYEFCVAIDDKFEFAYRNMADAFMRLKWYEKALEVLDKHIEIAKPEDVIFEAMGYCWEKKKDFAKARHFYRQALQLNPKDDNIFYKIGETYARQQQWEKAIKSFSVALNLNKENASYSIAVGDCLMALEIKNEALLCYLNAVRLKPGNKSTWVSFLRGLYLSGFYDEVITQIEFAKENCGEKGDFYYYYAASLFELGKVKEAMLQLEKGIKLAPKRIKVFTELNPEFLLRNNVAEMIGKHKKK